MDQTYKLAQPLSYILLGCSKLQSISDSITFNSRSALPYHYILNGHLLGRFSIDSAWEVFKDYRPINSMHHLLWFLGFILTHSFILWLASIGWLNTMDKLHVFQIITFLVCIICRSQVETHENFFFHCYNLGCYHEHDPYGLTVFDMVSSTLVGIQALEKEGIYVSTCLVNPLSISLLHLV